MNATRHATAVAVVVACLAVPPTGQADPMYGMSGMPGVPRHLVNPQEGMYGSMGGVYGPYYGQSQPPLKGGMSGMYPGSGMYGMSGRRYALNPSYGMSGMYGSMGNVYSPYYGQSQPPLMSGMSGTYPGPGPYGMSGRRYALNPSYGMSGMYGSMGSVYNPYRLQSRPPGVGAMPYVGPGPGMYGVSGMSGLP